MKRQSQPAGEQTKEQVNIALPLSEWSSCRQWPLPICIHRVVLVGRHPPVPPRERKEESE